MPWFIKSLDPDLELELNNRSLHKGIILDLCTGPGTQAVELSRRGFTVTAFDISETAIKKAQQLSNKITFKRVDFLHSTIIETFDYIFDRGCFHTFPQEEHTKYIYQIKNMLNDTGLLFLKCFSIKESKAGG